MSSNAITYYAGDYGDNLNFTLKRNGVVINLTGYTVKLKVWADTDPDTLLVDDACVVDVAANGTCHYTVQLHDFDIPGVYRYEHELTATGVRVSSDPGTLTVKDSG
jgi:hypothetical protein